MASIGSGIPAASLDLRQVAPGDVGTAAEHLAGQGLLDGQTDIGEGAFVRAADAAVGGQADPPTDRRR